MARMRVDNRDIRDADIFQILLDSFPDMIHSVDTDGVIVYANKAATALLGYPNQELVGKRVRDIYAPEVQQALNNGFTDLQERGDKTVDSLLQAKSGERVPVRIRSFSIYDDDGNFLRTFSILQDVRKIKELEQSLVHAGRLAAIGELASGIAHDINNPLTVILLSNEMVHRTLASGKAEPARIGEFTADVQKAAQSIEKLVGHLRNFSRGVAENMQAVDLYDAIVDALFVASSKIQKSCTQVNNEVQRGRHYILGRANNLEQVFMNLIANACDAMEGRPDAKLTIRCEAVDRAGISCWRCSLADSGPGIPAEIRKDIFRSFFTTKEKGKGTGLGLSIARGITRDHNGDIELESELGHGTTFHVIFPQHAGPTQP